MIGKGTFSDKNLNYHMNKSHITQYGIIIIMNMSYD